MVRVAALAASVYLVIAHAAELDSWFWIGLVLVVLNLAGLVGQRRSAALSDVPAPRASAVFEGADSEQEGVETRLVDLLDDPAVASAWAAAPEQWQQVAYLDDPEEAIGPVSAEELAEYVWLAREGLEWQISVGDEVKPYLDLDAPEDRDPILRVLRAHLAVADAWHEDREVYVVRSAHELALDWFAPLAAGALATGQVEAAIQQQ